MSTVLMAYGHSMKWTIRDLHAYIVPVVEDTTSADINVLNDASTASNAIGSDEDNTDNKKDYQQAINP